MLGDAEGALDPNALAGSSSPCPLARQDAGGLWHLEYGISDAREATLGGRGRYGINRNHRRDSIRLSARRASSPPQAPAPARPLALVLPRAATAYPEPDCLLPLGGAACRGGENLPAPIARARRL